MTSNLCAGAIGAFDFLPVGRLTLEYRAVCTISFRLNLSRLSFFSLYGQRNKMSLEIVLTAGFVGTAWPAFACTRVRAHGHSDDAVPYVAHVWL